MCKNIKHDIRVSESAIRDLDESAGIPSHHLWPLVELAHDESNEDPTGARVGPVSGSEGNDSGDDFIKSVRRLESCISVGVFCLCCHLPSQLLPLVPSRVISLLYTLRMPL